MGFPQRQCNFQISFRRRFSSYPSVNCNNALRDSVSPLSQNPSSQSAYPPARQPPTRRLISLDDTPQPSPAASAPSRARLHYRCARPALPTAGAQSAQSACGSARGHGGAVAVNRPCRRDRSATFLPRGRAPADRATARGGAQPLVDCTRPRSRAAQRGLRLTPRHSHRFPLIFVTFRQRSPRAAPPRG